MGLYVSARKMPERYQTLLFGLGRRVMMPMLYKLERYALVIFLATLLGYGVYMTFFQPKPRPSPYCFPYNNGEKWDRLCTIQPAGLDCVHFYGSDQISCVRKQMIVERKDAGKKSEVPKKNGNR